MCFSLIGFLWWKRSHFEIQTKESYDTLRQLVRFFPDGGLVLADKDGVIVECNTNLAKMMGKSLTSEVIGTNVDQFHPQGAEHHKKLRESYTKEIERRPIKAMINGNLIEMELSITQLTKDIAMARIIQKVEGKK
jgi:PAS domain S-box-containing protein